ncbi:hypothetical protein Pst134EA_026804 [Puccinia striiformis f. sp. tritici]|uniref:hypothetical protein n=1 Tax=Puccinia striiformis f. sp. tritici TaxID=168172 RepID=UPI0020079C97|nr:hypothetical protein Pst134EA_026804 [Puccinia striiformis f. sp. tritici]KAH9450091.1 hypothetical protein Pst134EA_026804 [Puccinia striiformis f. sp. tritici]
MEYNIHFISTSNVAGPLELAESIVNQLNELATEGSFAYDFTLQEEVLFMTVPLCFLADSPMAAEITNTPIPGNCNNPCRICKLRAVEASDRRGIIYIQKFFGIPELPDPRMWSDTVSRTKNSWNILLTKTKKAYEDHLTEGGLTDKLQEQLIEQKSIPHERKRIQILEKNEPTRLANPIPNLKGFDGCLDTPVEILHVLSLGIVKYLVRDFMAKLSADQLRQMEAQFLGKDFRTIVQLAPFVFFPFMNQAQIDVWIPLCFICSMAFQTHIRDMDAYLEELEFYIKIFMYNIVQMTAQWSNKPKFHMLLHLPASIKRYGPACLFATEKFESFNGVVRNASIHSNRGSPGRDIAITFSNYQAMGYNEASLHQPNYPIVKTARVAEGNIELVPDEIRKMYPNQLVRQVASLKLNDKESIKKGSFILQKSPQQRLGCISCVQSIWEVISNNAYFVKVTPCSFKGIQANSMMRIVEKQNHSIIISVRIIKCCINMQHNCFDGKCEAKSSTHLKHKRQEGNPITRHMVHTNDYSFLLNAFAHHEPSIHRELANLNLENITDQNMIEASYLGQIKWDQHAPPAQPKNKGKQKSSNVASTSSSHIQPQNNLSNFSPTSTSNQMRLQAPQNNMHLPHNAYDTSQMQYYPEHHPAHYPAHYPPQQHPHFPYIPSNPYQKQLYPPQTHTQFPNDGSNSEHTSSGRTPYYPPEYRHM